MSITKQILICNAVVLFSFNALYAQTVEKQIEEPINYKQKQAEITTQVSKPPKGVYRLEAIEATESTPDEDCFEIEKITFTTSTLLSDDEKTRLIEPFLGECNAVVKLDNMTKEITNYYRSRGYVTSKAFLQPQDLSDGEIEITVVEGKVEKIVSEEFYTGLIYPWAEGELFNINDFEAGMEQFNRLDSLSATMNLKPGSKPEYSIVEINTVEERSPYTVYAHLNSYYMGAKSTRNPMGVGLDFENPFGLSDQLSIYLNTYRPKGNKDSALGSSVSYGFAVPYVVLTLGYSEVTFDQAASDMNYTYDSNGRSKVYSFGVGRKLYEDNHHTLDVDIVVAYKENKTFLPDFAQKRSYKVGAGSVALRHRYYAQSYSIDTALEYHKGSATGNRDFDKYIVDLALTKYFAPEYPLIYNLDFFTQQSGDSLYGAEQISMGGPYTVRGFKEHGLIGNSGMYFRNELLYEEEMGFVNLYPYAAWDYGRVDCEGSGGCGDMHGGAVGLRVQEHDVNFDLYYSFPIKKPNENEKTGRDFIGLSLTLSY